MTQFKTPISDTELEVWQREWTIRNSNFDDSETDEYDFEWTDDPEKRQMNVAFYVVGIDGVGVDSISFKKLKNDDEVKKFISAPGFQREWTNDENTMIGYEKCLEWFCDDFFRDILKERYEGVDYKDGFIYHDEPVYDEDGSCENYEFLPDKE